MTVADDESPAPEAAVDKARRELGEMLKDKRLRARMSQRELGRKTKFDHAVVTRSEKGEACATEAFWNLADKEVDGGGTLTAKYGQVRKLEEAAREEARQAWQAAREERATPSPSRPPAELQSAPAGPAATVFCPNCCHPFELVTRFPAGQEPGIEASR